MKNKAGMWFVLAIGGAIGLLIATGFAYYSRKYEDQFASIKAMDPKIRVRESRSVVRNNTLHHWRLYESDKPVWFYCDEAIKANPKTNLVTSQIKEASENGRDTWFFAQFQGSKKLNGVSALISGGTFGPSYQLETRYLEFFPNGINKSDISKSTLIIVCSEPLDPVEKILATCGFYR